MNIVAVYWRDISGVSSKDNEAAWFTKEQATKESQRLFDCEYISVGEIIAETDNFITIAATTDSDADEPLYSDISMIMRSVIIKVVPLRSVEDERNQVSK